MHKLWTLRWWVHGLHLPLHRGSFSPHMPFMWPLGRGGVKLVSVWSVIFLISGEELSGQEYRYKSPSPTMSWIFFLSFLFVTHSIHKPWNWKPSLYQWFLTFLNLRPIFYRTMQPGAHFILYLMKWRLYLCQKCLHFFGFKNFWLQPSQRRRLRITTLNPMYPTVSNFKYDLKHGGWSFFGWSKTCQKLKLFSTW